MSTSIADVTCADVSSDRRMCSAIPRRIADIGSRVSPAWAEPTVAGTGAAAGFAAGGACASAGALATAGAGSGAG